MVCVNAVLTIVTCALYIADTYERNQNLTRGTASSTLLSAYITTDFSISVVFALIFVLRR